MNMRFAIALLASLAFAPFAIPATALADAGQATEAVQAASAQDAPAVQSCPPRGDRKFNTAQVTTDCCKDHKGVCGCRAGKIICCDGTASTQPGCTCHGDNGFIE
ncbi:MAG: hypothetical protein AB1591_03300 [Pseudomonadota bacterium]